MEVLIVLIVPMVAGLTFLAGYLYEKRQINFIVFALLGLFIGGFIGFLLRPYDPLFRGQLPFEVVITRGSNLEFPLNVAVPLAQTSFNYMLAGAILGAICGIIVGYLILKQKILKG